MIMVVVTRWMWIIKDNRFHAVGVVAAVDSLLFLLNPIAM